MKQSTIIDPATFQTITTLETECAQCHSKTRHVAHATRIPPYDEGIAFSSCIGKSGMSFLDYEKIIQKQSDTMFEMLQHHNAVVANLHEQIKTLQKAINDYIPQLAAGDDEE